MAKEDAIWALGCMSGTSMDGVDGAMVLSDGHEVFEFGATGFLPYSLAARRVISAAMGKWPGEDGVAEAARVVEEAHATLIARFQGAKLVGFHGQTLAHAPGGRGTHQVGDGGRLARAIGLPVAWDFRSADVDAGGQGAPLAPFYHFALARRFDLGRVAFVNLGGVGNVTFVDAAADAPEADGALLAFDTGPGNALMDDLMRARIGLACDYGGALAATGEVDRALVADFLAADYFARKPPKSLDRNEFYGLRDAVSGASDADALATLAAASVAAVARAFDWAPFQVSQVLVCGGGRHNDHLMAGLAAALPASVRPVEAADMDGDMLEAQAFGMLGVRVQAGLPLSAPTTTGVERPLSGGRLSGP